MRKKIQISELAETLGQELAQYGEYADLVLKESCQKVAEDTAALVKSLTPYKDRTGEYRASIEAEIILSKKHNAKSIVRASGGEYRISHLLENGHAIITGGRTRQMHGRTRAFPHIQPGEEYADRELLNEVKRRLQR